MKKSIVEALYKNSDEYLDSEVLIDDPGIKSPPPHSTKRVYCSTKNYMGKWKILRESIQKEINEMRKNLDAGIITPETQANQTEDYLIVLEDILERMNKIERSD